MGTASFVGNSVTSTDLPNIELEGGGYMANYKQRNGGAVFNKVIYVLPSSRGKFTKKLLLCIDPTGLRVESTESCGINIYRLRPPTVCPSTVHQGELVFEGATLFEKNRAYTTYDTNEGKGGAIYNARVDTIMFNAELTASGNNAYVRVMRQRAVIIFWTPIATSTNGVALQIIHRALEKWLLMAS